MLLPLYVPTMNLLGKNLLTTLEVPARPAAGACVGSEASELCKILVSRKVTKGSSADISNASRKLSASSKYGVESPNRPT